jgi:hypothetical protein
MTENVEALWRFIPPSEQAKFEEIAQAAGISKGGALALKMCQEALRDYAPANEHVRVAAVLASIASRGATE